MLPFATDWSTISGLVTGVGTLVLAIATFASVRSSNRSARIAEAALQEQRRPVLAPLPPRGPGSAAVADAITRASRSRSSCSTPTRSVFSGRITRFGVFPAADSWLASVTRHWYLDWDGPRPERDVLAAAEVIHRDKEAAERRMPVQSEMDSDGALNAPAPVGAWPDRNIQVPAKRIHAVPARLRGS